MKNKECIPPFLIEGKRGKVSFISFPQFIEHHMIKGAWAKGDKITRVEDNKIMVWETKDMSINDYTWVKAEEYPDYANIYWLRNFERRCNKIVKFLLKLTLILFLTMLICKIAFKYFI